MNSFPGTALLHKARGTVGNLLHISICLVQITAVSWATATGHLEAYQRQESSRVLSAEHSWEIPLPAGQGGVHYDQEMDGGALVPGCQSL